MKNIITGILLYALMTSLSAVAQQVKNFDQAAIITPYHLQINDAKTTVILFPNAIKSVDRGSRFVLAEKVKDAENVLKLKADRPGLPESNLSVITADGKLYSFIVDYTADLSYQAIDLRQQESTEKQQVQFEGTALNDAQVKLIAGKITSRKGFMNNHDETGKIKVKLEGIYLCQGVIFYQFRVHNGSHLDYGLDFNRFYVRDNKKMKRMAIQENEIKPIYQPEGVTFIPGKSTRTIVFAFKQFTIADNKNLAIEFYEQHGDRNPALSVDGKEILKARPIN